MSDRVRIKICGIMSAADGRQASLLGADAIGINFYKQSPRWVEDDTAEAILREAGGRITDMFGRPLEYNVADARNLHGLVASNSIIHDRVIEAVKATR